MSDGNILHGQQYEPVQNAVFAFTEQVQNFVDGGSAAALGTAKTEVIPLDANSSKVRTFTPNSAALEAILQSFAGTTNLQLPDTLTSLSVVYNFDTKDGAHTQTGDGIAAGTSASLTLALNSRSQSAAAIIPDLQWNIVPRWGRNVPVTQYFFYMTGNVTQAAAITRLNTLASITVLPWPLFRPVPHTFTLKGQSVAVSADAEVQQHVSYDASSATYTWGVGEGGSKSAGVSIRTITLPPTIHADLSVSGETSKDATATADAEANFLTNGTNWPEIADPPDVTKSATAVGSITPTSVSATTGATAIPSSGRYLHEMRVNSWRDGYNIVFMEVVNFADVG